MLSKGWVKCWVIPDGQWVLIHWAHLLVQLSLFTLLLLQCRQVLLEDVRNMGRLKSIVLVTDRRYHRLNNLILRTKRLLVKQSWNWNLVWKQNCLNGLMAPAYQTNFWTLERLLLSDHWGILDRHFRHSWLLRHPHWDTHDRLLRILW